MKAKKKILIATTNKSKLRPFDLAWEKSGLDEFCNLIHLKGLELSEKIEVKEDTGSFEADALKKAKKYCEVLNLPIIAIDRGIEFDALNGWPGTKTKKNFSGSDKRIFDFEPLKLKLTGGEADIQRSQAVLDRIKNKNRKIRSVYGIAVVFPDGDKTSQSVVVKGKASDELRITPTGYFYDWFFIPEGYNKTLSEFSEDEYLKFVSEVLWPIPNKVKSFLREKNAF